jgi:hypothetical protein
MQRPCRDFDYAVARDEERTIRILSTCKVCGASKIVSIRDGSLRRWELQHTCAGHREHAVRVAS